LETDTERIAKRGARRGAATGTAQTIDQSKWPKDVRPIGMSEVDGLGIDSDGRSYWSGKPVEIIGRRIDSLMEQTVVAIAVAVCQLPTEICDMHAVPMMGCADDV
jgi:hypothetical protein